jgi:hypothetical protein
MANYRPVANFFAFVIVISANLRKDVTTSIIDTSVKFPASVNVASGKFAAGVVKSWWCTLVPE